MLKYLALVTVLLFNIGLSALTVYITPDKQVSLLDVQISDSKADEMSRARIGAGDSVPANIVPVATDIGMSSVPVIDQLQFGTCVTFATTAAINARFSLGDFISQQCTLELNMTLGDDLWDGAYYPSQILDPLKAYGVVSKSSCNAQYPDRAAKISIDEYKSRSDSAASALVSGMSYTFYPRADINVVKSAILGGKRVLIAFLVSPSLAQGYDAVVNGVKRTGGLWACSDSQGGGGESSAYEKCLKQFPDFRWFCDLYFGERVAMRSTQTCGRFNSGHEVIITGFDDKQKLLKIRNSWGTTVGEDGEYYMSYEYFNSQVMDMTVIN